MDETSKGQDAPSAETQPSRWLDSFTRLRQRLAEHKVIQWTLAYLAAALALAHGAELVGHAFEWPLIVSRTLIVLLALGLPVAATIAWYHGHRGARRVSGAEMTIISILLLIGAGLLVVFVRVPAEHAAQPSPAAAVQEAGVPAALAPAPALGPAPLSGKPRIAILPFENLSPDPANAFFTDGLHEQILSTLANSAPGLEVISRTTMMIYRAAPKPVAEIAKELGATHVLEGSVRREGKEVRLTLQLIDARSDQHLWSQDYDRTLTNALTLQSEVASVVAQQLSVQLIRDARSASPPTTSPEAYDLFLKARIGRQQINPNDSALYDLIKRIDALLARAIELDPNFGLARLERANHDLTAFAAAIDTDETRLTHARADLDAAGQLIPGDPVLAVTEAFYRFLIGDRSKLSTEAEAALNGSTSDTVNFQVGQILLDREGRFADTLALFERWARLDPGNTLVLYTYAWELANLRRPAEALHIYDLMNARLGTDFLAPDRARVVFAYTGNIEEWRKALDRVGPLLVPDFRVRWEATVLRLEHRYADLMRYLDQTSLQTLLPDFYAAGSLRTGPQPIAELRGWAALLQGDKASAAKQGRALEAFAQALPKPTINLWYPRALMSEAYLFTGEKAKAITAARESIAFAPRAQDALAWHDAAMYVSRVFSWAGDGDDAVGMLEQLATVNCGLGPAEITRDPFYTIPLEKDARYQALSERLEAQIRASTLK